jgi:hypothetical protein
VSSGCNHQEEDDPATIGDDREDSGPVDENDDSKYFDDEDALFEDLESQVDPSEEEEGQDEEYIVDLESQEASMNIISTQQNENEDNGWASLEKKQYNRKKLTQRKPGKAQQAEVCLKTYKVSSHLSNKLG